MDQFIFCFHRWWGAFGSHQAVCRESEKRMNFEYAYTDNWLLPTGEQERRLRQWAGMSRFVWNRALSMESSRYRRGEKLLGAAAMMRELTQWRERRRDTEFLRGAPVHVLQNVLWDLYASYERFFEKKQDAPPHFKKKSKAKLSVTKIGIELCHSSPRLVETQAPAEVQGAMARRLRLRAVGGVHQPRASEVLSYGKTKSCFSSQVRLRKLWLQSRR